MKKKKNLPDMHTWKYGVLTSIPKITLSIEIGINWFNLSLWLHCWIWDHRGLLRISTDWKWTLTWLQSGDRDKLPVYSDVLSWTVFLLCFLANLVLWCVRSQVLFIRWSYIGTLKKKNPTHALLFLHCLNTCNCTHYNYFPYIFCWVSWWHELN